jgi:hypothetical protein
MTQPHPPNTSQPTTLENRVEEIIRQLKEKADRVTDSDKVHIEIDCGGGKVILRILNIYD